MLKYWHWQIMVEANILAQGVGGHSVGYICHGSYVFFFTFFPAGSPLTPLSCTKYQRYLLINVVGDPPTTLSTQGTKRCFYILGPNPILMKNLKQNKIYFDHKLI